MRSISETEADGPSRGRGIFQQKNIRDRADAERSEAWGPVRPLAGSRLVGV